MEALVIDNGSSRIKAGFARGPSYVVFSSVVGRRRRRLGNMVGMNQRDAWVGHEAEARKGVLTLSYPIDQGIVTNWDDMEKIWHHAYYTELRVAPEEHLVLLTEATLNPKANRERMAQIMFETFNTPAIYIQNKAVLALEASVSATGAVLVSGDTLTQVVPVYDSYAVPHAINSLDVAGRELTMYMMKLLIERGYDLNNDRGRMITQDIKEALTFVSMDLEDDMEKVDSSRELQIFGQLPDGSDITMDSERFRCPEILFQPSLIGKEDQGIHKAMFDSIEKCDANIRSQLYSNIVLSGGTTLIEGLAERLTKELVDLTGNSIDIKVYAPPEREYSAWIGGSFLASLSYFQDLCVSKHEYETVGPSVIHEMKSGF